MNHPLTISNPELALNLPLNVYEHFYRTYLSFLPNPSFWVTCEFGWFYHPSVIQAQKFSVVLISPLCYFLQLLFSPIQNLIHLVAQLPRVESLR